MKATEKKEISQVFELTGDEVLECFKYFLRSKGMDISEKAKLSFDFKVGATSRDIESAKITIKLVEEGTTNGKPQEASAL